MYTQTLGQLGKAVLLRKIIRSFATLYKSKNQVYLDLEYPRVKSPTDGIAVRLANTCTVESRKYAPHFGMLTLGKSGGGGGSLYARA